MKTTKVIQEPTVSNSQANIFKENNFIKQFLTDHPVSQLDAYSSVNDEKPIVEIMARNCDALYWMEKIDRHWNLQLFLGTNLPITVRESLLIADNLLRTLINGKMSKARENDSFEMYQLLGIFTLDMRLPRLDPPKAQPRTCQMPGCDEKAVAICTDANGNSFSYCAKHAIIANPFISEFRAAQGRYHD